MTSKIPEKSICHTNKRFLSGIPLRTDIFDHVVEITISEEVRNDGGGPLYQLEEYFYNDINVLCRQIDFHCLYNAFCCNN